VTAGGDHKLQGAFSTKPPAVWPSTIIGRDVFPDAAVRFSASTSIADDVPIDAYVSGFSVLGDALYQVNYTADDDGTVDGGITRIGGGWSSFVALDASSYADTAVRRTNTYGLRNDGSLFRWTIDGSGAWRGRVSAPGFAAVKSMALISATRTYDTFLANTRGGALYTIHVPTTAPMKPVVKLVRASTWQRFDSLLANRCGQYGVVLAGTDRDTKTGYLYAVGHANGTSTVIQTIGQIPATLADPVYFNWDSYIVPPPFGE
jgi:hypothetical protein